MKLSPSPLIHALWRRTSPHVSAGLREATEQFAAEVVIRKRHLRGVIKARKYRGRSAMAMHLGSGDKIKQGWVNIDLNPSADLTLDLREPLPFSDNTFRIIYSEHFLEHFNYPRDITHLLSECYRVLEPDGILSFAVPDGEFALRYYTMRQDTNPAFAPLHADVAQANLRWEPTWCRTQMDHVNYLMRQGGEHRWCYDEETMRLLLEQVGFVEIKRRAFDPGLDQEVRRFPTVEGFRDLGALYMQCRKPQVKP